MITEIVCALETYDAIDTAVPADDTIIQIDKNGYISDIPERNLMMKGQKPQAK